MIVFIKSFKGTSKDKGNPFQVLTLAEVKPGTDGMLQARVKEFFVKPEMNCNCEFGDVVQVKWSEGGFGGSVEPEEIGVIMESPFKEKME